MTAMSDISAEGLPDFVIIGAMKAGTTSLHYLLDAHPDVFIPDSEIFFFDIDEFDCHHDFAVAPDGGWIDRDFERHFDEYLSWYRSFFEPAPDGALIGEDSTTYCTSKLAPARMSRVLDEPKFVLMARDPADRAYSQYWHLVRNGRRSGTFEEALRAGPHDFLKYGYYQENLERYLEHVEDSQIRCVIFERFVQETQTVVDEVCDFLGLEAAIDVDEVNTHRNRARVPRFPGLKRLTNALGSNREATLYSDHLPDGAPTTSLGLGERVRRSVQSLLDDVALLASKSDYPPMDPETRDFLTSEFKRHNPNLSSLVGRDVSDWWEGW